MVDEQEGRKVGELAREYVFNRFAVVEAAAVEAEVGVQSIKKE